MVTPWKNNGRFLKKTTRLILTIRCMWMLLFLIHPIHKTGIQPTKPPTRVIRVLVWLQKQRRILHFLLHDLYHLKPSGIMTIVLPHGVLFRGGEDGGIRKNLIENNHIDTIIGLPANIFFGTGIPIIIMVLKQKRDNTDVLIIDASKGFTKEGKKNKLRASDIKKIADAKRKNIKKFASLVSRDTIRKNEYNLNIPRY